MRAKFCDSRSVDARLARRPGRYVVIVNNDREITPSDAAAARSADDDSRSADEASRSVDDDGRSADDAGRSVDDAALLAECRVETFRAGGPGGQHQNKTESAVRLTHLPSGIIVSARESRSQHRNRQVALSRLREALEERSRVRRPRVPTRTPAREKRRRLEEKRRRSEVKRTRKKPDAEE